VAPTRPTQAREKLWDLLSGGPTFHAVAVVSRLAIPDLLDDGPRTAADLARATRTNEDSLYRLLRALACVEVFAERPGRHFALTPISRLLRTKVPGSMRALAVLGGEQWRRAWYDLEHAVRTGRPAFERVSGSSFYEWLATEPAAARRFEEAQRYKWETLRDDVVDACDFSDASRIVDVGGGSGMLLEAILGRAPNATGMLVETPAIVAEARRHLRAAGLSRRCRVVEGDFVRSVPSSGDVYILAFVLHNWDDRRAVRILRNCRRAMADGGRVLVVEILVPASGSPSPAKIHDLEMLVFMPGGRERTRAEYRALLAAAGLKLSRVVPTGSSASVLVARD
jgi:ubiquinone/menaquinone biosynthesis C-methylase UbiE